METRQAHIVETWQTIAATVQELEWMRGVLAELGISGKSPIFLRSDNQGTVFNTSNPMRHMQLKHVVINRYFVRERAKQWYLIVKHVLGSQQRANILTKALRPTPFLNQRRNLVCERPRA